MSSVIFTPFTEETLLPQEERLEIIKKKNLLSIGIPKEVSLNEKRIPLTPDAVQILVSNGYQILIEKGAGEGAFFQDLEYSEAGAKIVDKAKAFEQDLILKINPPTDEEIHLMKNNSYLISTLQINLGNQDYFRKLSQKKINAIAFEFIKDENNEPVLVKMIGEVAGRTSILYAAELLAQSKGLMLGGITGVRPVEVLVLGAGIVGEYTTKTALGLGATVKVFDNSLSKLSRLQSIIGNQVVTSVIDPKELTKSIRRADVIIGALPRINLPPIVTEQMVNMMKQGSVIIDLTTDVGKCIETIEITEFKQPYTEKYGILHCGLPNLTSKMSRTTSKAISNFFLSYLIQNQEEGGFESILRWRKEIRKSFYLYKGLHTNQLVCDKFQLKLCDIDLLLL